MREIGLSNTQIKFLCAVIIIAATGTSCRLTPQTIANSQQDQDFSRLQIIYTADCPTGPLFTECPHRRRSQLGIAQASATSESVPIDWSKAELRIVCPHPDGRKNFARVTLVSSPVQRSTVELAGWKQRRDDRVDRRQNRRETFMGRILNFDSPATEERVYAEMDLPRSELDSILKQINSHGFFDESTPQLDSTAHLEIRMNRQWIAKQWRYEPVLDELTTRVYEYGNESHESE